MYPLTHVPHRDPSAVALLLLVQGLGLRFINVGILLVSAPPQQLGNSIKILLLLFLL